MQSDDLQRIDKHPARRRSGRARLLAIGLIAWGTCSFVTFAVHLVHRVVAVLVVATVVGVVVTSRVGRKP